jgi:hypothetical protein
MATSFSASLSALPIWPLHSYGASIVSRELLLRKDIPSYLLVPSNISMLMDVKTDKISLGCSTQATVVSSGLSIILKPIQVLHFVLQEAHLTDMKSLLPSIQVVGTIPHFI